MNDKTMQQVYLLAQEHCGLKVGDWVRVTRRAESNEAGWGNPWIPDMNVTVGNIGKMKSFSNFGVSVYFGNPIINTWNFPYFVLEKIEKPAHEFKPFDRVLVRDSEDEVWRPDIFSRYDTGDSLLSEPGRNFQCLGDCWMMCIPYEGNEHLVGTRKKPEE